MLEGGDGRIPSRPPYSWGSLAGLALGISAWTVLPLACAGQRGPGSPRATSAHSTVTAVGSAQPSAAFATNEPVITPLASAAPTAASSVRRPGAASSAAAASVALQGYVGKHPIRAHLTVVSGALYDGHIGDGWDGSYRYLGKKTDLRLQGRRVASTEDEAADDTTLSGAPVERFACELSEHAGDKLTGTVSAECDTSENELSIDGTWTDAAGLRELPFFLGPVGDSATFETYYAALLKTPGPARGCAPHVRVGPSVSAPRGLQLVSYVLSWPCEASSGQAFVAKVDPRRPEQLDGAALPFGAIESGRDLSLSLLEGGLGNAHVYEVGIVRSQEPGPDAARSGWSSSETRRWLLPLSEEGRLGRALELPKTTGASGLGSCMNHSASFEFASLELDGKSPAELIVTLRRQSEKAVPAPKGVDTIGGIVCEDEPPAITRRALRLDPKNLRFTEAKAPGPALLGNAHPLVGGF